MCTQYTLLPGNPDRYICFDLYCSVSLPPCKVVESVIDIVCTPYLCLVLMSCFKELWACPLGAPLQAQQDGYNNITFEPVNQCNLLRESAVIQFVPWIAANNLPVYLWQLMDDQLSPDDPC